MKIFMSHFTHAFEFNLCFGTKNLLKVLQTQSNFIRLNDLLILSCLISKMLSRELQRG